MKLPQLPRAVHFNNRRSNQTIHQTYDPYQQQLQDIRDRQTQLFQLVHQQQPPPAPVQQPSGQPTNEPVSDNQNSASAHSFSPIGAPPNVPSLADQLHALTVSLNEIEALQAPNGAHGAPTTHTPRLVTVG